MSSDVAADHAVTSIVQDLRVAYDAGVMRSLDARRTQLKQLRRMLVEAEAAILAAMVADLGKPPMEAYAAEIGLVLTEIDEALKHLGAWAAPERTKVALAFKPGAAEVVPEPLGVVLIIAPWNYPVQLLLAPLVAALAAGNTVVVKPSEVAPATAAAMAEMIPRYLDTRVVRVVTGGVDETTALLAERFDHIFYTGNGTVGRIVMTAAAKNLTPVTLELGGKSPTIVAADADLRVAARRIAWGKFLNAGQTCVAPDYVLVAESVEADFTKQLTHAIEDFYGKDPQASPDYARIVNERHWDRLTGLLDGGGYETTVCGGHGDRATKFIPPTVLRGVKPDAALMQEEIFGPLLPVISVTDIDEAIRFVNDRDKPLALYIFSRSEATISRVLERTSAGGVCINHTVVHVAVGALPFGGVGGSGMGAYHGKAGFDTFSHRKAVLRKPTKPDPSILYPPYKAWKFKLVRKVL
ncbi:MAG TPA: aldehyde dehydrogenase family protein [Ilumatobacteraceae bacterium]